MGGVMGLFAIVAAVACSDSTGPKATRVTRRIYNIQVPASAGALDSIRMSFEYEHGYCDSALVVEARPGTAEIRFAASSISTKGFCPDALPIAYIRNPVVYVVAPPHALPYTAKFAEPAELTACGRCSRCNAVRARSGRATGCSDHRAKPGEPTPSLVRDAPAVIVAVLRSRQLVAIAASTPRM